MSPIMTNEQLHRSYLLCPIYRNNLIQVIHFELTKENK